MTQDKIVLSYGDSLLRESDVCLLDDGRWLNDRIIGFVFEYFEREKFKSSDLGLCFIQPTVAHFIKLSQGKDETEMFIAPLDLASKDVIFIPLNDNEDEDSPGGSHWSLLVYCKKEKKLLHLDSFNKQNKHQANLMRKKLHQHLKDSACDEIIHCCCPQQTNGFDCGMYLICYVDEICKNKQKNEPLFQFNFDDTDVRQARESIKNIIHKLSENQRC